MTRDLGKMLTWARTGTAPDRELDAALCRAFLKGPAYPQLHCGVGGLVNGFTGSIDAAVALVEVVVDEETALDALHAATRSGFGTAALPRLIITHMLETLVSEEFAS